MVHLNRNQLSEQQLDSLFQQLSTTLGKLSSSQTNVVLIELLGHEERIMLAKRLACVVLLLEGTSLYKTAQLLKISPSTAKITKKNIAEGKHDQLMTIVGTSKKSYYSFLETLDAILHLGGILPHYNGLDRYKHLR